MNPTAFEKFIRAYIECALWLSEDNSNEQGGYPLDENYDPSDLAPETRIQMEADCLAFYTAHDTEWSGQYPPSEWTDDERAGHDFWLSRNGHGAGFFDRGSEPIWDVLQEAARKWGEFNLYVGDDGLIYGG